VLYFAVVRCEEHMMWQAREGLLRASFGARAAPINTGGSFRSWKKQSLACAYLEKSACTHNRVQFEAASPIS
jgi:hypothetical protein